MSDGKSPPSEMYILSGLEGEISVVDPRALLPGDVILSTTAKLESWLIRTATWSDFSHALLHVGHGVAIEANDPGVVAIFLPVLGHDAATRLIVRRKRNLTSEQRKELVRHALDLIYRPYSTAGAVASLPIFSFLRKTRDPGRFCSQLVAQCYAMIEEPICKAPEACTPQTLAASDLFETIKEGVTKVQADMHAAVTTPYAERYVSYLKLISQQERDLIAKVEAEIPLVLSEKSYNIFDFARQVTSPALPENTRTRCDEILANAIEEAVMAAPLRPCPGLSVATFLFNPPPLPTALTRAWDVVSPTEGRQAVTEKIKDTFLASRWELARWREESERFANVAEQTGLDSFYALAAWTDHAVEVRLMYAALCAPSTAPGGISRAQKNEIKKTFKAMIEQDPVGAQEFSVDPWMLLQQEVIPDA